MTTVFPSQQPGRSRSLALSVPALLLAMVLRVLAADPPSFSEPVMIRSQSGQFLVYGLPMPANPLLTSISTNVQYLRLDPKLLAVSLERIRQAIASELDWPNEWRGMILAATEPVRGENTRVTTTSEHFDNGWRYRILFPEIVDRDRFVGAAVKVILLEFANRRANQREADLPPWLVEGMTAALMARSLPVLALEPGLAVNQRDLNPDPLADVRDRLRQRDAFSFDELSMPTAAQLSGQNGQHYRACAHLFVHELLLLREGRAGLRHLLERLPDNFNWQTTFLQVFEKEFARLLDVDRWYSLAVIGVRGRDTSSFFPPIATLQQLDSILATSVEVRTAAHDLPIRYDLPVQRLIREWDYPRQHSVLVEKISRLQALRGRAASETTALVGGYADALLDYVGPRNLAIPTNEKKRDRLRARGNSTRLIEQLNKLDAQRSVTNGARPAP